MKIALTFDADWAPDFVLQYAMEILSRYGFKSTFFFTNPIDFAIPPKVEIGIHPDFMGDSPQGKEDRDILSNLLDWFPEAKCARTHRLYWDYRLYELFPKYDLKFDSSLFLPFQSSLEPSSAYGPLVRMPVWWTDNLHVDRNLPLNSVTLPNFLDPGIKVLIFHPINIYLNIGSQGLFGQGLDRFCPRPPDRKADLDRQRNSDTGMETFLETLCRFLKANEIDPLKLSEL